MLNPERQPIRIVTDDGASKRPDDPTVTHLGIEVLPLHIIFPNGQDIPSDALTADEFYAQLSLDNIPSTSAVSPAQFEEKYETLADQGATTIFSLHIPEKTSSTFINAQIAADTVMGRKNVKIHPIDTLTMSAAQWFVVEKVAREAKNGALPEHIQEVIDYTIPRVELFASFDTLKYFQKGGRSEMVKGLFMSLLSIQPILGFEKDGTIAMIEKQRTLSKARERMFEMVLERGDLVQAAVITSNALKLAEEMAQNLRQHFAGAVGIFRISPSLAVHGGPGIVGYCIESKNVPKAK
jgi:DegV family protein with EDD domain